MGTDTPLAVLSDRPQLLFNYFKQLFAQVTNPPIDPIREDLVMSLKATIGAEQNLFDETAEHCHQLELREPDHQQRRAAEDQGCRHWQACAAVTLPALFQVADGGDGLRAALDELCRQASAAIERGLQHHHSLRPRSRRDAAPIPSLLATGAVHHHLIREGHAHPLRPRVESGEPREVHHFCLLIGYGAGAVNPYLACETVIDMVDDGALKGIEADEAAVEHYLKAANKGLLKVMTKMGISTVQSYRGAQIFEAIGLNHEVIDRYFTWTASRIEGVGLDVIAEECARASPPCIRGVAGTRRRPRSGRPVSVAPARRVPHVQPGHDRQAAARRALRELQDVQAVLGAGERSQREAVHDSRPAEVQAGDTPIPIDEVEPASADRQALQDRRHVPRLDQPRGTREPRHRHEPHRRQVEHRRRRRGPGALHAGRQRRLAPQRHQAGGLRPLRRHQLLSGQLPTSCRSRWRKAPSPAKAASCRGTRSTSTSPASATRRPASA